MIPELDHEQSPTPAKGDDSGSIFKAKECRIRNPNRNGSPRAPFQPQIGWTRYSNKEKIPSYIDK